MNRASDVTVFSSGPVDTAAIAASFAGFLRCDDVVVLGGDLGAGKTTFTKALCAELGVTDPVTSPTFTLAQQYQGTEFVVHHLDVYRLDHADEALDLALPELFESGGVVIIEWGERIAAALPRSWLHIGFDFGEGDDDRRLSFTCVGTAWHARREQLEAALASSTLHNESGASSC